jgi:uncharacterized protein (TIGR03437 family)
VTRPQQRGQANYNLALAVDPTDANIVYYGTSASSGNSGGTLFRSRDGGQNWVDLSRGDGIAGGLHADTHAIAISAANHQIVFTGNDGGVWRTDRALEDLSVRWENLNATLNITQFQSVAMHPTDARIVIGGTQDNGTNRFEGDLAWTHIDGGDGGFALIDQSNPQFVYHTYFNQNNSGGTALIGPAFSANGGQSWVFRGCSSSRVCGTTETGRFNPADRVGFYAPMALNTAFTGAAGNVVYFGTHRLYRTSDQGQTWTGLGPSADRFGLDLTKGAGRISAIAAHPALDQSSNPPGEIVWIGTNDGLVQVTSNAGALGAASFSNVTRGPLPNRYVTDIGLDPGRSRRAVVAYSGFSASTPEAPGHVFLTDDLGGSWRDISGDLPDVPVTSVALDPNNPEVIYIGTDIGVFRTTDGGQNWERPGPGLPRVAVYMLRYHAASGTVIAATHGRGMFRLATARPLAIVSAASYSEARVAPDSIASAFGEGLAATSASAATTPLPTTLAGSQVRVLDSAGQERLAPLFFVGPTQVNFLVPAGTAAGAATFTVTSQTGIVSAGTIEVGKVAPALFSANAEATGPASGFALRFSANGAQTSEQIAVPDGTGRRYITSPIDPGPPTDKLYLVLYGTGFRDNGGGAGVTVGGVAAAEVVAVAQGGFFGLDQVNLLLSRELAGRGEVDLVLSAGGESSNAVRVQIK